MAVKRPFRFILSLTTHDARYKYAAKAVSSLLDGSSILPAKIVVNVNRKELTEEHQRELVRDLGKVKCVADTKTEVQVLMTDLPTVWKKFLPTFGEYRNDWVLAIDDDKIYHPDMLEAIMKAHDAAPNMPISGTSFSRNGLVCHCGCLSLVKEEHFKDYLHLVGHVIACGVTSSDLFYTWAANRMGYTYKSIKTDALELTDIAGSQEVSYSATNGLKKSERLLKLIFGSEISFCDNKKRREAVLNVMDNDMGRAIASQMLEWMSRYYNVFVVKHDGSKYEYYGIDLVHKRSLAAGHPVLYLHTKGAVYTRRVTSRVHEMWRDQFGRNADVYFRMTKKNEVKCPFTGPGRVTWYNGFVTSPQASKAIGKVPESNDRMYYESRFSEYEDLNVTGVIASDVEPPWNGGKDSMHKYLREHYDNQINYF